MDLAKLAIVRGIEENVLAQPYLDGQLYFTTDTKRIYMDCDGQEKLPMGGAGNSAIFFGVREIAEDEVEAEELLFTNEQIEGDKLPEVDSLILNAPDGCFYRVSAVDELNNRVLATKLTVAGGGGSGSGDYFVTKLGLTITKPNVNVYLYGQENSLTITPKSACVEVGVPVDNYLDIHWKIKAKDDSTMFLEGDIKDAATGEPITFEFGSKLFPDKNNIIEFTVTGYNSGTMKAPVSTEVKCVQLQLVKNVDFDTLKMYEGSATLACEVYGAIEKILEFWVDGELVETKNLGASGSGNTGRITRQVNNLSHGTHSVEIKLYQSINGEKGAEVPSLKFEIAAKEAGNNTPIIWLGDFKNVYENYEQILIPYMAFNPTTGDTCTVRFYKNDAELNISPASVTFSSDTSAFETLEITNANCPDQQHVGDRSFNTYYITCGNVSRTINFYVHQSGKMVLAAPDNLLVLFDAAGRSNNESTLTRDSWTYTGNNGKTYSGVFDNFNWYNNGWMKDADGNTCLRISNGAQFSIPLGATTFNSTVQGNQSQTFEFQFKVRNIQNYEKLIKLVTRYSYDDEAGTKFDNDDVWYNEYITNQQANYDSYEQYLMAWMPTQGLAYDKLVYRKVDSLTSTDTAFCNYYDSTRQVGFCLGTQDAFFKTNKATLNANYVEDKIVNLAFVYSQSENLVSIYLNGVLSGAVKVGSDDGTFTIGDVNSSIVFNSSFCDIDLYKFRTYNTSFSIPEILNNYSIDLRDTEMYEQSTSLTQTNQVTKEQELYYDYMIAYNEEHPDDYLMPYFVFSDVQGDALPYSKLDEKNATMTFVNTGLDRSFATGDLAREVEKNGYSGAIYPVYWMKLEDLEEAVLSPNVTANYKVQLYHQEADDSGEMTWVADAGQVNLDMTKVDRSKAKRKSSGDNVCVIYRTLTPVENYYLHHGASFEAKKASIKTQGTSSQFYPRRNYKAKNKQIMVANKGPFENDNFPMDWFYMDNDTVGTSKFTLKIDYMESSGSYNTGAANLVGNAYTKHPIDDYPFASQVKTDDLRTSVQGFPAMAFHKKSDGTYTYIGRYNMNIDKGSDECYGYKAFANNDLYAGAKITTPYVLDKKGKAKKIADVAECWEFSDNNRGYCSFRDPLGRDILSFDYAAVSGNSADAIAGYHTNAAGSCPVVADSFEYRYNASGDLLDYFYNPADPGLDIDGIKEDFELDEATMNDYDWRRETLIGSPMRTDGTRETPGLMTNWEKACQWVWSTCVDNVDSEDNIYETYAGRKGYTSYDGTVTIKTYDPEDGLHDDGSLKLDSYEGLIFNEDDLVVSDAEAIAELEEVFAVTGYALDNLLKNEYGVLDESALVETYIMNTDSYFTAFADVTGYKYIDYVLDTDGNAQGNFKAGTIIKRADALEEIQANASQYATSRMKALATPYISGNNKYYFDTKEYRLAKFKKEFTEHFDKEYALVYFVMTEVLMCYDSRGKNAMFASWGPQKENGEYIWYPLFYDLDTQLGINNTGIPSFEYYVNATEDGCFSTNDSVLWGNIYRCFLDDIKSTYQALRTSIKRGSSATNIAPLAGSIDYFGQDPVEHIENWYKCNPDACNSICMKGKRPLIAINLDEYYKYISIMNEKGPGYQGTDGTPKYDNSGAFLYALQGDRSLSRQQFLSRRINFVDSWLTKGNYAEGTGATIKFRTSANDPDNTSDIWVDNTSVINASGQVVEGLVANANYYTSEPPTIDQYGDPIKSNYLDADFFVKLTPYQRSYVTLATDNAPLPSKEYEGSPVRFEFPANVVTGVRKSPQYAEQLLYLYGANYMKDIGDVSLLYPREFELKGATHLQRILLGNDTPGYKNKKLKSPQFDAEPSTKGTGGKPLLKEVVFTNVQIDGSTNVALDFSSSEKLQIFRALGMNLSGVKFADGVALHTLHLPATITELTLKEARNLQGLISEYSNPTGKDAAGNWQGVQRGLYIKDLTDITDAKAATDGETHLNRLTIAGGNMGYDSFDLLKRLYLIKENTNTNLAFSLTDVNWTPFTQLVRGSVYNVSELNNYYIDNEHYQLVKYAEYDGNFNQLGQYVYDMDRWKEQLKNGMIYYKDPEVEYSTINKVNDDFLYKLSSGVMDYNNGMLMRMAISTQYTNTDETNNEIPRITGNVYVNNVNGAINEGWIRNTLLTKYPDLNIFVNDVQKAYSAKFVKVEDDGSLTTLETYKVSQEDYATGVHWFPVNPYSVTKLNGDMNKQGWDFYGWSTARDNKVQVVPTEAWASQEFTPGKYEYTFYAVYEKHKYNIEYRNYDDSVIEVIPTTYGESLTPPAAIPYKDENALPLETCYSFTGYSRSLDGEVIDLEGTLSTEDLVLYAVFAEKSVYDNVLDDKYLIFDALGNNTWTVRANTEYQLSGKITLPTRHLGGSVIYLGDDSNLGFGWVTRNEPMNTITHVFWDNPDDCAVTYIGANTFRYVNTLRYVQIPPQCSIAVARNAFNGCTNFLTGISDTAAKDFFNTITYFGDACFSGCVGTDSNNQPTGITKVWISPNATTIKGQAFNNCYNITNIEFGAYGQTLSLIVNDCGIDIFRYVTDLHSISVTYYLGNYPTSDWETFTTKWGISDYTATPGEG